MNWIAAECLTIDQNARVGNIILVFFDDFAMND